MPRERLNLNNFQNLRELEQIAVDLITEYADQFWREQRRRWESENIEVVTLDKGDRNNAYVLSVTPGVLACTHPVTVEMALRIGKLVGNGPELWLRLQQNYDLCRAEQGLSSELEKIKPIETPAADLPL